ncbi:MAG: pilus assembly protein N-terminal domain-containing protein, partial [Pseudomonadota bacterium]
MGLMPTALVKIVFALMVSLSMVMSPQAFSQNAFTPGPQDMVKIGGEGETSRKLILPLGKAAIVELPRDASDIMVSNPAIVDPVIRTPRKVYITGLQPGQANAFFFDRRNNQIL